MKSKNRGKIIALIFIGLTLIMTVSGLIINNVQARPIDGDPWFRTYYRRILVSEGYLNPNGINGDWLPENIISVNQLVMRPEIPGTTKQLTTQYSVNTLDVSAKVTISGESDLQIGVQPVGTTHSSHGIEAEFGIGYIAETDNRDTTVITIGHDSDYELGFSATVYELLLRQYYWKYRVEVWAYWNDGTNEYLGVAYEEFNVATTIMGAQTTTYEGIGFDYDDEDDKALYPYITQLYENILDDEYTISEETRVWGSLFTQYSDYREESGTWYGSVSVEYTHGWGAEVGFGGTSCSTEFEVSISGTVKGSTETGKIEIATFTSGFYESGDNYRVTLKYLSCGAFWVTGYLDNPDPDPEPEPEPIPDPIIDPRPDPKDPIDIF
jgi:hypothetical protein